MCWINLCFFQTIDNLIFIMFCMLLYLKARGLLELSKEASVLWVVDFPLFEPTEDDSSSPIGAFIANSPSVYRPPPRRHPQTSGR